MAFIPYNLLLNECLDKTITGISLKINHSVLTNIPLWGNELILNDKSKPLYLKNWINSGILSVKDIQVENQKNQ